MLYTTSTAAQVLDCHRETVRRLADKFAIGERLPVGLVFTDSDLALLRGKLRPVGNPNMEPGNKLWKRRKKSGKSSR
jgi:hypothetical protein